jgi:hypothetical protein
MSEERDKEFWLFGEGGQLSEGESTKYGEVREGCDRRGVT